VSEPTYEVWHLDGRRPELLSGGHPDKGVCRRAWRLSTHAVIAKDGLVLEPKPSCDSRKAKALASAIADAHRAATGSAPTPAFVGPAGGDGKRILESSSASMRALDPRRPAVEPTPLPTAFDEAPAPVVVVTRKPTAVPAPETPAMTTPTTGRCPCGAASAPTNPSAGGRPSTPQFADLCKVHRVAASNRRYQQQLTPDEARAKTLASIGHEPAPRASKAPASKPRPSKPAPVARAPRPIADAPVSDLLAVVRRQRAAIDLLGGIDQAERVAAACARVGGAESLVALVDELARAVA
jgi:hypothetical protein